MFINGRKIVRIKKSKNPKTFLYYSQAFSNALENLEDYNPKKKRKVLVVFDDMIADMEANQTLSPIATELFWTGRKLKILLVFILQSYFKGPKNIRLNAMHYLIMKISSKRALNHSPDIAFNDLMKLYKFYTKEPFSVLVKDTIH